MDIVKCTEIMVKVVTSYDETSVWFGQIACLTLDMHNSLVSAWISTKLGAFDSYRRDCICDLDV